MSEPGLPEMEVLQGKGWVMFKTKIEPQALSELAEAARAHFGDATILGHHTMSLPSSSSFIITTTSGNTNLDNIAQWVRDYLG